MLQPIKNFFNYLQKNASTSTIFGLTAMKMSPIEDPALEENDMMADDLCTDPLYDPLALDDCDNELNINNNSIDSEIGSPNGQIVLVDVQTFKKNTEDCNKIEDEEILEKAISLDDVDSSRISEEIFRQESITLENGEDEEEAASDGSDSGLGSEPSRNTSTLEKDIIDLPPTKSNMKRRSETHDVDVESNPKRLKRSITFDGVTVYYFQRMQGFGCVPSQGGCTLGMEFRHAHTRTFTLSEHAAEQRKFHKQQLLELNPRCSSSEETDSEEDPSESGSEAESESYGFLQPVPTRQRRALLKAAGVRKIDSTEKDECRAIRSSREVCGCTCRGYCDPDTCACSQSGIKCQVDRPNFPCGCAQDGCANVVGRVEFNPARVRTHFIHTIMRLNLDNKELVNATEHGLPSSSYSSSKDWLSQTRLPTLYTETDGLNHQNQYNSYLNVGPIIPQQSISSPATTESLDLHYAFRDYYSATPQQNDQLSVDPTNIITPSIDEQHRSFNEQFSSDFSSYNGNLEEYHQHQLSQQHSSFSQEIDPLILSADTSSIDVDMTKEAEPVYGLGRDNNTVYPNINNQESSSSDVVTIAARNSVQSVNDHISSSVNNNNINESDSIELNDTLTTIAVAKLEEIRHVFEESSFTVDDVHSPTFDAVIETENKKSEYLVEPLTEVSSIIETGESLCEIIKNSIADVTVSN